jgi:hypothetical protein
VTRNFPSIEWLPAPRFATWEATPEVFAFAMEMVRAGADFEFIAPSLDSPLPPPARKQRKPSIATLIKRVEKSGKRVTSITTPDGMRINFDEPKAGTDNPWPLDEFRTKETKQ